MESVSFLPQPAGVLPLERSFTCPPVPTLTLTPRHNDKDALAKLFSASGDWTNRWQGRIRGVMEPHNLLDNAHIEVLGNKIRVPAPTEPKFPPREA